MKRHGFQGHGQLGAAELVGAVVADDHVLEPQEEFAGKWFAGQLLGPFNLVAQHLDAHDQVTYKLPQIGVGEGTIIRKFVDLADIVQENAGQEKVSIDFRIEIDDAIGNVEQGDHVLEQPALIGVVVLDPRRRGGEFTDKFVIDQKALDQGPEV